MQLEDQLRGPQLPPAARGAEPAAQGVHLWDVDRPAVLRFSIGLLGREPGATATRALSARSRSRPKS
ncbi:MAG: hypothetical protein WKG07_26015 [Hymenobacter sp.]